MNVPIFIVRNLTIPFVMGIRSRYKTVKELKIAEKVQWLSHDEILDYQWGFIKKIINDAYRWIPYYRKVFDEYGIKLSQIQSPYDLKVLPALTKDDINNHREEMVDPRYRSKIFQNFTGGSTGVPTCFYQTHEHWIKSTAARIKNYKWTGAKEGDKTSIIWGHSLESNYSKMAKVMNILTNRQYIPALSFDNNSLKNITKSLIEFKPKIIEGYSTYLYIVANFIIKNNINAIKPMAIISTANTLLESQRKTIEKAFECKVYNRYGSRDIGCIASECSEHNGLHINAENVYVEFEEITSNNSQIYKLICTSLGNRGMPFIRYEIGDLGVPFSPDKVCSCGRKLPLIKKLIGRTHDILRTPSGRIIAGDVFDIIFQEYSHIVKQFQVCQKKIDFFEVSLLLQSNANKRELNNIKHIMENIIGSDVNVSMKIVDNIPVSPSGKLRLTISEI